MQPNTYSQNGEPRRLVVALVGAAAVALTLLIAANGGLDLGGGKAQTGSAGQPEAVAAAVIPSLANGPVPGMPRGTYEQLTSTAPVIPSLANGPVPGMPRGTYEQLTSTAPVVSGLANGPVPGMPRGTFERLTGGGS